MLEDINKRLSVLKCDYVNTMSDNIISQDYGIKSCGSSKPEFSKNLKYLKVKKDFLNYYSKYTEDELKAFEILYNKNKKTKESSINNIGSLDDKLYQWFLTNIKSIESSLNTQNSSDKNGVFIQNIPSQSWIYNHGFGFMPAINVIDLNGNEILGYVRVDNPQNTITTIQFDSPQTGKIIAS